MKFKREHKEETIEILRYLAAEDPLVSLGRAKWANIEEVRSLLADLAQHLEDELQSERSDSAGFFQDGISSQAKQIISTLSPREERLLFKSFKLNG